jgi:hypothetical protein
MPFLAPIVGAALPFLGQMLVSTALSVGASLLMSAIAPKPEGPRDPGVSLNMQIGGDNPLSFHVGLSATAGHRIYAGTWGSDGETPNAFFADVLELGNAPIDGLNGVYANGERATVYWGEAHPEYGYPVSVGRRDGKDHLWVKIYDGRQTAADPYLRAKFGNHPERPYGADMVGNGTPYAVVTTRYNRELWQNGAPKLLFEVRGLRLYDIRKDSSAGGLGVHRRNDPSTWEWSENPYVIAYNAAFMGVYVGSEWLWGLQNLPAMRLPQSAWIAAMNEADRALAAWGNQRQFTIGGEITVDMEPASVLDEIAKSSLGRFIESAGAYKPRCGAPGTSVYSFGEADILITDPRTITPFPGLEQTHNTVEASYAEPGEAWGTKAAPVQSNAAYIAADGNRKLSAGLSFPMVHRNEQVQRLSYSYLEDGRRFRVFSASFHPITWLLEPGDVIDGTILAEGYSGKKFEILQMQGRRTFVQTITLREIDPADFDPPASAYQPWTVGPIQTIYPPSQPATGISFAPYTFFDSANRARRPGIEAFYQGGMDDVQYFAVRVFLPGQMLPFFENDTIPYRADVEGEASQPIFSQSFVSGMAVEVQGKYVPFSSRSTDWSTRQAVTLPDVRLSLQDINDEFRSITGIITGTGAGSLSELFEIERERLAKLAATGVTITVNAHMATERARAEFTEQINVVVDATQAAVDFTTLLLAEFDGNIAVAAERVATSANEFEALSQIVSEVAVEVDGVTAGGIFAMQASAGPSGWQTKISAVVRASANGSFFEAGWYTLLNSNGDSIFAVKANSFYFLDQNGQVIDSPFYISGGTVYIKTAVIQDLSIGTNKIANNAVTDNFSAQDNDIYQVDEGTTAQVLSCDVYVSPGSKVYILAGVQGYRSSNSDAGYLYTRLRRGGDWLQEKNHRYPTSGAGDSPAQHMFVAIDDPSPGWHSYNLECHVDLTSGRCNVSNRSIVALVVKK